MVIVWGEPVDYGSYEEIDTWQDCLDDCYEQEVCVLVYLASPTINCLLFRFGNITSINKLPSSSPQIVAFRTSLSSSTCPDSSDSALNSQSFSYTSGQSFYNSTITSSTSTYLITYSTITCPVNSTLLIRPSGPVCVGIRYFPSFSCKLWADASTLCGESGGMGLTGPLNATEYNFFMTITTKTVFQAAGMPTTYKGGFLWIDGNSVNVTKEFIFQDPTHNGWAGYSIPTSGVPKTGGPGYCFYFPSVISLIDDYK